MASTIAIAISFQIAPEKLESWLSGERPTAGEDAKLCDEIFSKFDYKDGEWSPKTKAKKTSKKKTKTKKAASTKSSKAASNMENNIVDSIVSNQEADTAKDKVKDSDTNGVKFDRETKDEDVKAVAPTVDPATSEAKTVQQTPEAPAQADPTEADRTTKEIAAAEDNKAIDESATVKEKAEQTEASAAAPDESSGSKKAEIAPPEDDKDRVLFTAVGIIRAEVTIDEVENQHRVSFGGKSYPLFYARKNYTAFTGLKKEIAATGKSTQRLIVYPKFTHFPKRDQPARVGFQLVGFDKGGAPGITEELKDNEFKICGLWQFIPVCRQPCISIFRNFTRDRLDYIKSAEAQSKVNFMKASHLPILWRDGPVKPFRFNPKLKKEEQAKVYFVQIKAKFLPQRDCFGFSEMLGDASEKLPKFLKASKADKAEVQKKSAKNKPPGKGKFKPQGKPRYEANSEGKPKGKPSKPSKPTAAKSESPAKKE